jgi:hypothetical protein
MTTEKSKPNCGPTGKKVNGGATVPKIQKVSDPTVRKVEPEKGSGETDQKK